MTDSNGNTFKQKLEDLREVMSPFIILQEHLLCVEEDSIEEIINFINENKLATSKTLLNDVLESINSLIRARPLRLLHYLDILVHLKTEIKNFFRSSELWIIFEAHKNVLLTLYEEGCIDIDTIKRNCFVDKGCFKFFFIEIRNNDEIFFNERIHFMEIEDFFSPELFANIDSFIANRKKGHCEWELAEIIREDKVEEFQTYLSSANLNLNTSIRPTVFESDEVINSNFSPLPTLIEYSAFFNSISIFKYLWLNLQKDYNINELDKCPINLPRYSIAGGCYEMIHICEEKAKILKWDEECVRRAIEYHHKEIVDYLHEAADIAFSVYLFQVSVKCFNLNAFFLILEANPELANAHDVYGMTAFHFACQFGHLEMAKFLLKLHPSELNTKNWVFILNQFYRVSIDLICFFMSLFIGLNL